METPRNDDLDAVEVVAMLGYGAALMALALAGLTWCMSDLDD